jgi:hypothetical protein
MEVNMSKRKRFFMLLGAGLVTFLCIGIVLLSRYPPFIMVWINSTTTKPRELPMNLIRPGFRFVTNCELPKKTDGLHAIFFPGRDPSIFLKFQTDSNGIEYLLKTFGGRGSKLETYDPERLKYLKGRSLEIFGGQVAHSQKKLGLNLFDQNSVESGRMLQGGLSRHEPGLDVGCDIFIEDQTNTVYVHASHH